MNIYIYFLIVFGFNLLYSQQNDSIIKGNIDNSECRQISLAGIVSDSLYYELKPQKYNLKDNNIFAEGQINFPHAFYVFACNENYGIYVLNKGDNYINLNKSDDKDLFFQADDDFKSILRKFDTEKNRLYEAISVDLKAQNNILSAEQKISYDHLIKENESIRDTSLYKYTLENKDSFFILWYLIYTIELGNYNSSLKKIYYTLSDQVKTSLSAKRLSDKIDILEQLQINNKFPIQLIKSDEIITKLENKKYVILDFWFSHCAPCLYEFPKYKEVYREYKNMGVEIVGVSTDRTQDINHWKATIEKYELDWIQYLDENGEESRKFNINKFPSNFLLDSNGKIIKKDISPEELELFLKQTLN